MTGDIMIMDSVLESSEMVSSTVKDTNLDFSSTNVQVEGIDEADIIKTDGTYIYTITDSTLFIINASQAALAEVIFSLSLDFQAQGLFIKENQLIVIGQPKTSSKIYFSQTSSFTHINIFDKTQISDLVLEENYTLEGHYKTARMNQEHMYIVLTHYPQFRNNYPSPIIMRDQEVSTMNSQDIYFFPRIYNHPQLIITHSFDLQTGELKESKALTVDTLQDVYASHNNIYIAGYKRISEYEVQQEVLQNIIFPKLSTDDKNLIKKIQLTDNNILSSYEKKAKILQIHINYLSSLTYEDQEKYQDTIEKQTYEKLKELNYLEHTIITKIAYNKEKLSIKETISVPGRINNQFSLDEKEEVLRIATTIPRRWSQYKDLQHPSSNAVWTYDKNLNLLGKITNIAENEDIFATRYIEDRLYMVTFEQIDPFFVIDLSNPKKPEILGELKLPGFSRYLHPYDENHIIGIGQETTMTGRIAGLKISIFDVSDVNKPIEKTNFISQERHAQSTALYEHKAFLFSREKNLLVIPAHNHGYDGQESYNGAFLFNISVDKISLRGIIDHSYAQKDNYWGSLVERSLFIDDILYTKSPTLLRSHNITSSQAIKDVQLIQETTLLLL